MISQDDEYSDSAEIEKISLGDDDGRFFTSFMDNYLRQDGVFVLRLIGHNTNAITVTEFVWKLWKNYRKQKDNNESFAQDVAWHNKGDDLMKHFILLIANTAIYYINLFIPVY